MRSHRSYDFRIENAQENGDGLTLEGYAAVFDTPAEIHDFMGSYTETVQKGAFRKTLQERTPLLQYDHGTHPLIGSIPLGVVKSAKEDDNGLFIRARLSDNWLVQPVREAIDAGAITGMSFQFEVTRDEWNKDQTERTIREVKLYELGPVAWPAYDTTTVGVRSEVQELLSCPDNRTDIARALCFAELPDIRYENADPVVVTYSTSSDASSADITVTLEESNDTPPVEAPVADKKALSASLARIASVEAMGSDYLIGAKNE